MKKIIKKINHILEFNQKYNLLITSSSLAFYAFLSISSFSIIIFTLFIDKIEILRLFLINDIINIIGDTFKGLISESASHVKLSGFNIIFFISAIYSSSSIINRLTIYTDEVYPDIPKRSFVKVRVNAILMQMMLILVILFEIAIVFISRYFLLEFSNNYILIKSLIIISEISIYFFTLSFLYMFLPPIKTSFKKVSNISFIVAISIYILLELFKIIFRIVSKRNLINALSFAFTLICFFLQVIGYIVCYGIIKIKNKTN